MQLKKPKEKFRVAVLVPCYKREDYSIKCLEEIQKAQGYEKVDFFKPNKDSLRKAIIDFFDEVRGKYDILVKVDNDCLVPNNWLNDLIDVMDSCNLDIVSPNVTPSNAAMVYGEDTEELLGYRKAKFVGGLWCMKASLIDDMVFEDYGMKGIDGAFALLKHIIAFNRPKVGWTTKVCYEDVGHWSGNHPEHVKSQEHKEYSQEVGRQIAWD